jgi:serine/threonine protein kinase
MELVEGQPLSALVPKRGLPVEKVLRFGGQIADALAHAHERRIVHRDLKSANVVITPEGRAKVLDFGLAKRLSGEELSEATTKTMTALTQAGALVGTVPYMAPEQLRAQQPMRAATCGRWELCFTKWPQDSGLSRARRGLI